MLQKSVNPSIEKTRLRTPGGVFALSFGLGFGINMLTVFLIIAWDIFWTDVVADNPHRPLSHALLAVPLHTVFIGIFFSFFQCLIALVALAAITSFSVAVWGRVLLWPLLVSVPLFLVLIYFQGELMPKFTWYTDHPDDPVVSPEAAALRVTVLFLPAVIGNWWILARRSS